MVDTSSPEDSCLLRSGEQPTPQACNPHSASVHHHLRQHFNEAAFIKSQNTDLLKISASDMNGHIEGNQLCYSKGTKGNSFDIFCEYTCAFLFYVELEERTIMMSFSVFPVD